MDRLSTHHIIKPNDGNGKQLTELPPIKLKYEVDSYYGNSQLKIGAGGYSSIYEFSFPNRPDKKYAIKITELDESMIDLSIILEIAILRNYQHQNIIEIIDVVMNAYGSNNLRGIGIIMPLAIGSLFDIMKENLSIQEKDKISYNICCGLSFLHYHDIIHRDIKPHNILIFENNGEKIAKITDMGVSAPLGCVMIDPEDIGFTLLYTPPEVLLGNTYDISADVWSLGCVLYELYTNKVLFMNMNPDPTVSNQILIQFAILGTPDNSIWDGFENLPKYNKSFPQYKTKQLELFLAIPDIMKDLILSCLTYDPNKRPSVFEIISNSYFDSVRISGLEFNTRSCVSTLDEKDIIINNNLQNNFITKNLPILLDWLFSLFIEFKSNIRTIHLALKIIDMYLEKSSILGKNFQLLGMCAVYISTNICDSLRSVLPIEYIIMIDSIYNTEQFEFMIMDILKILEFNLIVSLPYDYLIYESIMNNIDTTSFQHLINISVQILISISQIRYNHSANYLNKLSFYATQRYIDSNAYIPSEYIQSIKQLTNKLRTNEGINNIFRKYAGISYDEFIYTLNENII